MRRRTRNAILVVFGVVALLLALGALPGLIRWGDPYYLTASPVAGAAVNETVDAADVPEQRYPYVTGALEGATPAEPGRSEPYWEGPVGIKGAFTHSPFDEFDALAERAPNATDGDAVYVQRGNTIYRLAIEREDDT